MSNVAKLKKQATEFEGKKQFDKALAIYVKLLESFDENAAELDVALFNRVGDLMLRQGNVADAVDYYEQAVDRYADTGFFNNAIALCNKILRHSPGRASIYYKLGKISAQKGFKNDAKVNFLEYADRMQKGGKVDEAFRALKEFADLCPDQDEIRLMLADQLTKANRKSEAIEQLQTLYERYDADGRVTEAAATAGRIHAIDPSVEPRSAAGTSQKSMSGELIFLDLDSPSPRSTGSGSRPVVSTATPPIRRSPPAPPPPVHRTPPATPTMGAAGVTPEEPDIDVSPPFLSFDTPLTGITRIGDDAFALERTPSNSLDGLESTSLTDEGSPLATPSLLESLLDSSLLDSSLPDSSLLDSSLLDSPLRDSSLLDSSSSDSSLLDSSLLDSSTLDVSLLEIEPTPLEEPTNPVDRSTPPHTTRDRDELAHGELEFIVPDAEPTPDQGQPPMEFDLSMLAPATSTPQQPVPPKTTPVALEGLPLMDLDVLDGAASPAPALETPHDRLPTADQLELVEDPSANLVSASGRAGDNELIPLSDETSTAGDEPMLTPTPSVGRKATMVAAHSVGILKTSVDADPQNWSLHRDLAEAMLAAGSRAEGIKELESAMTGAERSRDFDLASSLAEEIARLEPESLKHHQKRVEYAFRTNDRSRLIEAYLSLADALLRSDQADKARMLYQRVLDLAPADLRARAALDAVSVSKPTPSTPLPPSPPPRAAGGGQRRPSSALPVPQPMRPSQAASDSLVNLGDWLRADDRPKDTRMVVAEQEPSGDEAADFADMLRKFKQGVAENVDAEDYQSHYDLAIAFKEMGLLDEAIAEFQKALGSPTIRLPTYEALGQCFLEKEQFKLASSILSRGLKEKAAEEQFLGIFYLLGRSAEAQGNLDEAIGYYQRVFVLDIQFRDTADRLSDLERAPR